MTQQPYQAQPQAQPQTAPPTPPIGSTPPQGGGGAAAGLQDYEVQFLGELFSTVIREVGPPALDWLQQRISTMGAAAQSDTAAVQAEAQQFQVQFLQFLAPLIPTLVNVGGQLLTRAISGQAAGSAGTQSSGTAGGQGAGTAGVADYTRG